MVGGLPDSLAQLNTTFTTINVMAVWTEAYECHLSKLPVNCQRSSATSQKVKDRIDESIRNTKQAFTNSQVGGTVNLVLKSLMPAFVETGLRSDLGRMNRCEIGTPTAGLCYWRDRMNANVVVAFTANGGDSGLAFKGPDTRLRSTALGKASSVWTMAHEIGHLLGCRDERRLENACDKVSKPNNWYGYRSPDRQYRDLMSNNCQARQQDCGMTLTKDHACTRMPHYGDPDIRWNGVRTGSSTECCACRIREVIHKMLLPHSR